MLGTLKNATLLDQTTNMGDSAPRCDLHDHVRVAMRNDKLWCQEKAMYAEYRIKHMACPCKLCKGSKKHMATMRAQSDIEILKGAP